MGQIHDKHIEAKVTDITARIYRICPVAWQKAAQRIVKQRGEDCKIGRIDIGGGERGEVAF